MPYNKIEEEIKMNTLYPKISENFMLIRQPVDTYIIPLYTKKNIRVKLYTSPVLEYTPVNRTGSEILELCNGENSVNDIETILQKKYQEDLSVVEQFVKEFLAEAESQKFIRYYKNKQKKSRNIKGDYNIYVPNTISFEITEKCPLKCIHCFNNSGEELGNELTTQQILKILEEHKELGTQKVFISGGEPSSRDDFTTVLNYVSDNFFACIVASNGYGITREVVEKLNVHNGNIIFQISLDGTEETHNKIRQNKDSFKRAIEAIEILIEKGFIVTVACTINKYNFEDMFDVAKLVKEKGVTQLTFAKTNLMGRAKKNLLGDSVDLKLLINRISEINNQYEDEKFIVTLDEETKLSKNVNARNCTAGIIQSCIKASGDVTPCVAFNFVYGNLIENDIKEVYSEKNIRFFQSIQAPSKELCGNCIKEKECSGCHAVAFENKFENCNWYKHFSVMLSKSIKGV